MGFILISAVSVLYDRRRPVSFKVGDLTISRSPTTGFLAGTTLGGISTAQTYDGYGRMVGMMYRLLALAENSTKLLENF